MWGWVIGVLIYAIYVSAIALFIWDIARDFLGKKSKLMLAAASFTVWIVVSSTAWLVPLWFGGIIIASLCVSVDRESLDIAGYGDLGPRQEIVP